MAPGFTAYPAIKRLLDTFLAFIVLIVLCPCFVLIALLVRLDSPGPALFRQSRVGRKGKLFVLFKFRTMRWGTPDIPTDTMARQSISPVTRLGRVLRRTSLDELPQLVNILRGDMSFVGPRPALPTQEFVNESRRAVGVDTLLPGITGWAQVSGRDALSDVEKVACDRYYRENLSLQLDANIVIRTVAAVFSGRGNR